MFQWVILSVVAVVGMGCSSSKKAGDSASNTAASDTKAVIESKAVTPNENATKSISKPATAHITGLKVECAAKGDTRILEIRGKDNGCELSYTKGGQEGVVASSSNGSGHCEKTLAKIKERLQGSGFTCQ
jgi:hypothetical protein